MAAPLGRAEVELSSASKQHEGEARTKNMTGVLYLGGISTFFVMAGFGFALAVARKKDPRYFAKGMVPDGELRVTGAQLALKALGIATLYSVGGFGLFCFGVAKCLGVSNLEEFHSKMQELIPRRKQPEPKGRTEFEGFRDLFGYLEQLDKKKKEFLARYKD